MYAFCTDISVSVNSWFHTFLHTCYKKMCLHLTILSYFIHLSTKFYGSVILSGWLVHFIFMCEYIDLHTPKNLIWLTTFTCNSNVFAVYMLKTLQLYLKTLMMWHMFYSTAGVNIRQSWRGQWPWRAAGLVSDPEDHHYTPGNGGWIL